MSGGEPANGWKRCSSCKTPIAFGATWWACNVSTCNRPRTGLVFCTVSCWDAHLSVVNHRESWALERKSPSRAEWEREQAAESGGAVPSASGGPHGSKAPPPQAASAAAAAAPGPRRILPPPSPKPKDPVAHEVLIVASRLKAYVLARSGFSTSDRVLDPLSDAVRDLCDRAIEKARAEGRKTVLERDFD
jgi:hypothetical protein